MHSTTMSMETEQFQTANSSYKLRGLFYLGFRSFWGFSILFLVNFRIHCCQTVQGFVRLYIFLFFFVGWLFLFRKSYKSFFLNGFRRFKFIMFRGQFFSCCRFSILPHFFAGIADLFVFSSSRNLEFLIAKCGQKQN